MKEIFRHLIYPFYPLHPCKYPALFFRKIRAFGNRFIGGKIFL